MNASQVSAVSQPAMTVGNPHKHRERWFFSSVAIAMALLAFLGFAPTYYLKVPFAAPELSPLLHLHGLAFSLWIVLLVTQTSLVAANRTDLHRRLGIFGALLAVAMMILGGVVAITRAKQGILGPVGGPPPLIFLAIPLMTLIVFPILFGSALHFRRRSDIHKRLVIIASAELVTAAIARLPVVADLGPPAFFGITDLFVVALVIYDYVSLKRLHPATLWGGLVLIVSQPLRLLITATPFWMPFAEWLVK